MRRLTRVALATAMVLPAALAAQGRCTPPDTTKAWAVKQRAWLDDATPWADTAFRAALLRAAGLTEGRAPLALGWQAAGLAPRVAGDDAVVQQLRDLLKSRGSRWPVKSVVGAAGVRAAWEVVQRDTLLQMVAVHRMMEAGPEESPAALVAMLDDRTRIAAGRKQLHGTVFDLSGAMPRLLTTEDSAHVDLRRDAAGLPPLAQSACAAPRAARH